MTAAVVAIASLGLALAGLAFALWRTERARGEALLREAHGELAASMISRTLDDRTAQLTRADEHMRENDRRHLAELQLVTRQNARLRETLDAFAKKHPDLAVERGNLLGGGVLPGSLEDPDRDDRDHEAVPSRPSARLATVPGRVDK